MKDKLVTMAHGGGGRATSELVQAVFLPRLGNLELMELGDAAVLNLDGQKLALTTDSFVVSPPFFPGGDIGRLAICGTVNDLTAAGAVPLYLTVGVILEEGFPLAELKRVVASMAEAADEAGVKVVAGDTKVVERGKGDGLFLNTSGLGLLRNPPPRWSQARPGDRVLVNGPIGEHGAAVISRRSGFDLDSPVQSDCAPLNDLIGTLWEEGLGQHIRAMRDPTRGGVATALAELAARMELGIRVDESALPISPAVSGVCDMLGFDPLYLANEGKMLIVIDASVADAAVDLLRKHRYGAEAAIIGELTDEFKGVRVRTPYGGHKRVDVAEGELLPRIC